MASTTRTTSTMFIVDEANNSINDSVSLNNIVANALNRNPDDVLLSDKYVFNNSSNVNTFTSITTAFNPNLNKVVIAYKDPDNSFAGVAIVGTVLGNSISFGSKVVFDAQAGIKNISATFDTNLNKVVIAYLNADGQGRAVVGEVSGNSISFGSSFTFDSGSNNYYISATFDTNSNKVVIAYEDSNNANGLGGSAIVGTVSNTGNSISFGPEAVFDNNSGGVFYISTTFDTNLNKVVIAYRNYWGNGAAVVGEVSGSTISFGSSVTFDTSETSECSATFDTNSNKVVIAYKKDFANGAAVVGEVSGSTISFGSPTLFYADDDTYFISSTFDTNSNKVVIAYSGKDITGNNTFRGRIAVGTVLDTTISFNPSVIFNNDFVTYYTSIIFDTNSNKVIIAYRDGESWGPYYGTVKLCEIPSLTITASSWNDLIRTANQFADHTHSYTDLHFDNTGNASSHGSDQSATHDTGEGLQTVFTSTAWSNINSYRTNGVDTTMSVSASDFNNLVMIVKGAANHKHEVTDHTNWQ